MAGASGVHRGEIFTCDGYKHNRAPRTIPHGPGGAIRSTSHGCKPAGLLRELTDFLRHNKKWWLIPIILVLLLVSALVFLTDNPVTTPVMYAMF